MPEPEADLALLIDAAREAGEIALRHFAGDRAATEKPGGAGPVTEADLEVDRTLRTRLTAARPEYGWLSEETPDTPERLTRETTFVVDPIDGTRAFVDGATDWAHSLAVVRGGVPVAAVVFLPALGRLYTAATGLGADLNGAPMGVKSAHEETSATILTTRPNMAAGRWPGGVPPVSVSFRSSLANRLALVAEGRFDGMLSFRATWDWDVAAGALLVTEAGGHVTDTTGARLRFNGPAGKQDGIIGAGPDLHSQLLARLNAAA